VDDFCLLCRHSPEARLHGNYWIYTTIMEAGPNSEVRSLHGRGLACPVVTPPWLTPRSPRLRVGHNTLLPPADRTTPPRRIQTLEQRLGLGSLPLETSTARQMAPATHGHGSASSRPPYFLKEPPLSPHPNSMTLPAQLSLITACVLLLRHPLPCCRS
jgi:hypothetical protein